MSSSPILNSSCEPCAPRNASKEAGSIRGDHGSKNSSFTFSENANTFAACLELPGEAALIAASQPNPEPEPEPPSPAHQGRGICWSCGISGVRPDRTACPDCDVTREDTTEETLPEDLPRGFQAPSAWTSTASEIGPGGTELLMDHLCPGGLVTPPLPTSAPPDDPDPHPALRPLSGAECVRLYRAADGAGRLGEILAAAEAHDDARLRELYSVLCAAPARPSASGSPGGAGRRTSRQGHATEEILGLLALAGLLALLLLGIPGCGDREGRPVRPLDCADFGLSPDSCL